MFIFLDRNNLLTEENFYSLMRVSINIADVIEAMCILEVADACFSDASFYTKITQETLDILIENHDLADIIARGFFILQSLYLFDTVDNRNFLIRKIKEYGREDSTKLMNALDILAEAPTPCTQEDFKFILNKQFADRYPTILNCMKVLSREGKLNEKTREYLLKNPNRAVILTKLHDTSSTIYDRSEIDKKIDDLVMKACILGQAKRDTNHIFSRVDSKILANIAYMGIDHMGTEQDNPKLFFARNKYYVWRHEIDQKTAILTAETAMKKANAPMIIHHYNEVRKKEQARISQIRFLGILVGIGIGIDPSIEVSHHLLSKTLPNKAVFLLVSISLGLVITSLCATETYYLSKKIEDNIIDCCGR